MTALGGETVGKPGVVGVNMNQRLSLSTPWEGLQMTGQGFKPDPRNPAVRHYRGASRNVRQGETVNPPAIERAGTETPHLKWGALDFYPDHGRELWVSQILLWGVFCQGPRQGWFGAHCQLQTCPQFSAASEFHRNGWLAHIKVHVGDRAGCLEVADCPLQGPHALVTVPYHNPGHGRFQRGLGRALGLADL